MVVAFALVAPGCRSVPPLTTPVPPAPSSSRRLVDPIPREVAPNLPRPADRVIAYPAVPLAAREGHFIELYEDLVIEERDDDRRYNFDRAVGLAVDEHGRLYVHDSERFRIVVYNADGRFSRAYGGAGAMAPFRLGWIAVAGERLAISTGNKITVWSLAGEHLYDRSLLRRAFWPEAGVHGTVDGSLVGSFQMRDRTGEPWLSVEKISLDEDVSFTYGAVPVPSRDSSDPRARPGFAVTRTGELFLTRGDDYVIQAFAADGAALWILHVDGERASFSEGLVEGPAEGPVEGSLKGFAAAPPALAVPQRGGFGRGSPLHVDGYGNLYVFPYVDGSWDRDEVPVDVYSPAGERLFAGFIADRSWIYAQGNAVYGIEAGEDAGHQRIVRYLLRAPFPLPGPGRTVDGPEACRGDSACARQE